MGLRSALVVDDSRSARFALRSLLEHQNIQVDTAATPQQALAYLRRHRPDVVFMDDLMPGMDGLEVIDQLANDPATARIPIVMYTGREDRVSHNSAWRRGVVGILSKPFTPDDVNRLLAQLGHDPEGPALATPKVARLVRNATAAPEADTHSEAPGEHLAPADAEALATQDVTVAAEAAVDPVAAETASDISARQTATHAAFSGAALAHQAVAELSPQPAEQALEPGHLDSAELDALRMQLVQVVKGETRLAVAQLVGELLEQQVSTQIRQRESAWRRALDGMRSDQERFQVQILEERVPRLLDLLEQRVEHRLGAVQNAVNERLEGGTLTPLQRTMVSHVARTAAAEAAQRPARQSARRVAAEFVRSDLNTLNQNFDRLRQRFNWMVGIGLVVMASVGVLAYLLGSQSKLLG